MCVGAVTSLAATGTMLASSSYSKETLCAHTAASNYQIFVALLTGTTAAVLLLALIWPHLSDAIQQIKHWRRERQLAALARGATEMNPAERPVSRASLGSLQSDLSDSSYVALPSGHSDVSRLFDRGLSQRDSS